MSPLNLPTRPALECERCEYVMALRRRVDNLFVVIDDLYGRAGRKREDPPPPVESPIEEILAEAMTKAGIQFMSQVVVDRDGRLTGYTSPFETYRLDFAVFVGEERIAIECDGERYHNTPTQWKGDLARQNALVNGGWHVLRFPGDLIRRDVDKCIWTIRRLINRLALKHVQWSNTALPSG